MKQSITASPSLQTKAFPKQISTSITTPPRSSSGSWYFPDKHGEVGGRLYTTAMAVMTLEVYYRFLPLYGEASLVDEEVPLEVKQRASARFRFGESSDNDRERLQNNLPLSQP